MGSVLSGVAIGLIVVATTAVHAAEATSAFPQTGSDAPLAVASPTIPIETTSIGLLGTYGQSLQNLGISIHGVFLDAFAANPNMGAYPGHTVNSGILSPEIDVDLRTLGLRNTTIHFAYTIYTIKSNTPTEALEIGDMVGGYLGLPIPNSNELTKLTLEQASLNGRLDFEAGKLSPDEVFARPNCGNIQVCISDPVLTADAGEMPFVYSVWGARIKYNLSSALYVQTAAFEDDWLDNLHNGVHWGTSGASGALVMVESGYRTNYKNSTYPSDLEFGGFYNTSASGAPKGFPLAYTPGLQAYPYAGGKGVFFRFQHVVYREPASFAGPLPKNVTVYAAADAAFGGPQPSLFTGWVGANATGFIPKRPFDAIGAQLTYNRISSKEVNFEEASRQQLGIRSSQSPNEFVLALDSQHRIASWLSLQLSAQYYINPNQFYDELGTRAPRNGFVTTANLIVSFGPLLGTSPSPF